MVERKRRLLGYLVLTLVAASAVACSGDDEKDPATSNPANGCAADTRKETYTPGMSKSLDNLIVTLLEAVPGPPAKGDNVLTLRLVDGAGADVNDATVTVTPWMPDHAHGSAVKPVATSKGGGLYAVDKIYLPMAGLWQLKVTVQRPNGPLVETLFAFCLDG